MQKILDRYQQLNLYQQIIVNKTINILTTKINISTLPTDSIKSDDNNNTNNINNNNNMNNNIGDNNNNNFNA